MGEVWLFQFLFTETVVCVCVCVMGFFFLVPSAKLEELKQKLLAKIAELGKELPLNTLDELIDQFGGPEKVSEVRVCMAAKQTNRFLNCARTRTYAVVVCMCR